MNSRSKLDGGRSGDSAQKGSDSDVCHLTGPRFSFGYLRLEIDTDGTFWTKRVYKMDRLITIPLSLK